jgi:post-segregation antitoxin (ccd killing protein)
MEQMLDLGASTDDVAERFATSTEIIDRWRAVLALPAALLTLVRDGTVEVSDIADLGELGDDEEFVAAVVAEVRAGTGPRWAVSRVRQQRALTAAIAAAPPRASATRAWRRSTADAQTAAMQFCCRPGAVELHTRLAVAAPATPARCGRSRRRLGCQ